MKTGLFLFPILAVFAQSAAAVESFHIYAPSRSTKQLLVVEAKASGQGLALLIAQRVDLGFAAGTIVAHPERPLLYVAAPKTEEAGASGAVVFLDAVGRVERSTGFALERGCAYLSLDRANRFLLGAGYSDGGVDVYALNGSGIPGKAVQSLDEGRRNAHCVLSSPDNRFVYIPYVKQYNALYQYAFDPATGRLAPLEPLDAKPPAGTGPRHMAYHPKLPVVYFSNEQHVGVSVYEHGSNYMPATAVYETELGDDWNHIMIVYDNKQPTIYLNGSAVRTGFSSPRAIVNSPIQFGGMAYGYFEGSMDEVRIYDRGLSALEITYLAGRTKPFDKPF